MSPSLLEFLGHINDETGFIIKNSDGLTEDAFLQNDVLIRAFCRAIEIIGEASKHIPEGFRRKYPSVPWKSMAGMRDVIIHDYFGINFVVVWEVITEKIPDLDHQIGEIIKTEQQKQKK